VLLELAGLGDELDSGPVRGRVSLGVSPSVGAVWTSGLVQILRRELPEVDLRVVSMLSGALGAAVARGSLDLGLLYSPTLGTGLVMSDLWEENSYLVVSRETDLCDQRSISLRRALSQPFILPSSRYGLRELLEEQARELEVELQIEVEVDSVQLAIALVKRNLGAIILTERALSDLDESQLSFIPIRGSDLRRSAQLVTVDSALRREAVRAVWSICETTARARRVPLD
jgi:LysR family nitrogen assimilation transcriptional regulator